MLASKQFVSHNNTTAKIISASEAKTRFGTLIGWIGKNNREVIVEAHGRPAVVVIPFNEYENLQKEREQIKRREALAQLKALRDEVQARNPGVTEEEALAIGDAITRRAIGSLVKKGIIQFDRA